MEILIISGLSGSGKSQAASYLEDIGYYTVDNLPAGSRARGLRILHSSFFVHHYAVCG